METEAVSEQLKSTLLLSLADAAEIVKGELLAPIGDLEFDIPGIQFSLSETKWYGVRLPMIILTHPDWGGGYVEIIDLRGVFLECVCVSWKGFSECGYPVDFYGKYGWGDKPDIYKFCIGLFKLVNASSLPLAA